MRPLIALLEQYDIATKAQASLKMITGANFPYSVARSERAWAFAEKLPAAIRYGRLPGLLRAPQAKWKAQVLLVDDRLALGLDQCVDRTLHGGRQSKLRRRVSFG